jgi:hypothetical protein
MVVCLTLKEGSLHDFIAPSLVGFLFGVLAASGAAGLAGGDMPKFAGLFVFYGLFFVVPGGFVAAYLDFRLHRVGENLGMEGLNAGFFTAIVYTIITLFTTLVSAIMNQGAAGTIFTGWIITVLLSFVFYPLGGYLCGFMEQRPYSMPSIFSIPKMSHAPPPPPGTANLCPTCGNPLRYIEQYKRWYCDKEQKYV